MAFAFDEYPTPGLPGTFIFDDFEDNNSLGFDPPALDDLPECFPLDTPSSNIFEEPSLTPSGSSAYGCGDWETLTPEEVLESQVSVKPKIYVQDTAFEGSEGTTRGSALPGKNTIVGVESTWDLSMNPVKSRKNRPKTKKQRAAASFVRKYGACSVHKKAKKSCACNLPAILRPISLDKTPQTADIDPGKTAEANLTPESMTSPSPNGVSTQTNTQAAYPHTHPSYLPKTLLIQRVLSMLLLALSALPIDQQTPLSQPDSASTLALIQQSAAAMGLPPGTFSHLESIAQSALTNSLVYFCPYVFTGCSFSTSDLDAFSLHTSNHPLEFVLGWDLFSLPSHYLTRSSSVSSGIRYQRDHTIFCDMLDDRPFHDEGVSSFLIGSLELARSPSTCNLSPFSLPNYPPSPLVQNYHLPDRFCSPRLLNTSSLHTYETQQQSTNPNNAQPAESLLYHPLFLLLSSIIWDTVTSLVTIVPFVAVFLGIKYWLLIISRVLAIQLYIIPLYGAFVSVGGVLVLLRIFIPLQGFHPVEREELEIHKRSIL